MERMKILGRRTYIVVLSAIVFLYNVSYALAQGGAVKGVNEANTQIKQLFDPVSKLIMAIGAVVGLIGGIRCYIKWNNGDQDVMKSVMGWGGACIFLVLVSVVIKAFFTV